MDPTPAPDRPPDTPGPERAAEALACVSRVSLFAGLTAQQQRSVARYAHETTLQDGERLYGVGDEVGQLFVVRSGGVRVVRVTDSGREQLIRIAGPGDVVGEYPFLTGRPPALWVFAVGPTRLCVFDHADLRPLITVYPSIALRLLASLAERLDDAERRFADLAGAQVPARLAGYLLALAEGSGAGRETDRVRLPMAKKDVASYLGTTPESLSRALHRLAAGGVIEVGEHGVVNLLDARALRALAGATITHP